MAKQNQHNHLRDEVWIKQRIEMLAFDERVMRARLLDPQIKLLDRLDRLTDIALIGFLRFSYSLRLKILTKDKKSNISSARIKRAPGSILISLVELLYSPKTVEHTFKPIVADWRVEYFGALQQGRIWKARWISIRYIYNFALAMGLSKLFSFVKGFTSAGK